MKHLLDTNYKIHVSATGAGARIQDVLWSVPGCSKFFVGAVFPYGRMELTDYLGFDPEKFCSAETAMDMAMTSYMRACRHVDPGGSPIGVGLCAAVTSAQPRRGENYFHVAIVAEEKAVMQSRKLSKNLTREECDACVTNVTAQMIDRLTHEPLSWVGPLTDAVVDGTALARERLFAHPYFTSTGRREETCQDAPRLFPGAFNPPHAGHFAIADSDTVFHITADSPHKAPLSVQAMLQRAVWLRERNVLFSEGDPLYLDKARRHPGCSFLIGADAALRMLDPKWGVEVEPLLQEFAGLNVKFFVSPREVDGLIKDYMGVRTALTADEYDYSRFSFFKLFQPGMWNNATTGLSSSQLREST